MNSRKVWIGLFIYVFCLTGCFSDETSSLAENNLSSPVPVTRVVNEERATAVPTPTFDRIPYAVSCSKFEDVPEENSHWADGLIPGESVFEEAQALTEELPNDEKIAIRIDGQEMTVDVLDYPFQLYFDDDGVLVFKSEPRSHLADIIDHYGTPDQVTWRIVSRGSGGGLVTVEPLQSTTTLFFHQSHAVFVAWEKIVDFWGNVSFYGSVYTPSDYDELFAHADNEVSTSWMLVRHSPWPCG